jgi:hypothetical protein
VAAIAVVAATGLSTGPAFADEAPTDVNAELSQLNTDFRGWYAAHRQALLASKPLVLVVSNQGVLAIRPDRTANYAVDLTAYTQVKSLLHAVLGFQGLMRTTAAAGSEADWSEVAALVADLSEARNLIPMTDIPTNQQSDVVRAYSLMIDAANEAMTAKTAAVDDIQSTLRGVRSLVYPTILWIGREHAGNIKSVLQTAKRDATEREWNRAIAVVTGPMTARRDNLETAVTARVLGPKKLGSRIFYAEGVFSPSGALSYLSTVIGDAQFSDDMFDSATRMWRDLFAETSRDFIAQDFYAALAH